MFSFCFIFSQITLLFDEYTWIENVKYWIFYENVLTHEDADMISYYYENVKNISSNSRNNIFIYLNSKWPVAYFAIFLEYSFCNLQCELTTAVYSLMQRYIFSNTKPNRNKEEKYLYSKCFIFLRRYDLRYC